jgi:hypothetical protein
MNNTDQAHSKHMTRFTRLIASLFILSSCQNKTAVDQGITDTVTMDVKNQKVHPRPPIHTDTLQFIHFEGNFDYWCCVFLNSSKDTIALVTDSMITDNFKNRLFEVKWFTDTLIQAGDNDSKFAANRMSHFRPIKGKPFVPPITEEQILRDVGNIPEVQSGAEQVVIAGKPSEGKSYYLIETGTHGEDNFSRFAMFRVYTYPNYKIMVYDAAENTELSLEQWRKRNQ